MRIDDQTSAGIAGVTLDRPPVNALTLQLYGEIAELFESVADWRDVNCIILSGAGSRAFCAGLDLHEFLAATVEEDPSRGAVVRRTFPALRTAAVPVTAGVNGPRLGARRVLASARDSRPPPRK